MREAGRVVANTLQMLVEEVRPGLVVKELDKVVRKEFEKQKVIPTFLGYHGYPATVCVSVNDEIVHGIPGKRVIQEGDVVSLDLGCTHKGFVADSALTIIVGDGTPEARELVDVTRDSLREGIQHARAGNRLGEISHAIQTYIESHGFGVVREYVGHGVGRAMHEEPQVPNYGPVDRGPVLLAFLRVFERRYLSWTGQLGDPVASGLASDYLAWCGTVGADVEVAMPDGSTLRGHAEAVDWDGRLVVRTPEGPVELASGDVRHVRRAGLP